MRIDSHQHFWKISRGDYGWITPELGPLHRDYFPPELKPTLDDNNIDGTILVQAAPSVAETEFMLGLADENDWILGVVGWIDFDAPEDGIAQLTSLAKHPKLVSVRPAIQSIAQDDWMLGAELDPVFRAIIAQGICFDALTLPRHLPHLVTLLQRYPDMKCVIDHGSKPEIRNAIFDQWARDMEAVATKTNALCKISGLVTEAAKDWTEADLAPYVKHLIAVFGPERLMFGSDWPVVKLASDYGDWVAILTRLTDHLDDAGKAAIWGDSAEKFYLSRR